jgi:hypothetical protein
MLIDDSFDYNKRVTVYTEVREAKEWVKKIHY